MAFCGWPSNGRPRGRCSRSRRLGTPWHSVPTETSCKRRAKGWKTPQKFSHRRQDGCFSGKNTFFVQWGVMSPAGPDRSRWGDSPHHGLGVWSDSPHTGGQSGAIRSTIGEATRSCAVRSTPVPAATDPPPCPRSVRPHGGSGRSPCRCEGRGSHRRPLVWRRSHRRVDWRRGAWK